MKNKHLLLAVTLVLFAGLTAFSQVGGAATVLLSNDDELIVNNLDPQSPADWINARRVNQHTGTIDVADLVRALEQVKALQMKGGNSLGMSWSEMGPNNIGGRTRALLIDKDNPLVLYAGGVSGGLWKSTTGGTSWVKVSSASGDLFENLAVSSVVQAANGDIYFGTGEGVAAAFGTNQNAQNGVMGQGIWKSTDHGNTFAKLGSTWSNTEAQETFVLTNAMATDPSNANRIYAATVKGLMVSSDGGGSWTKAIPDATEPSWNVRVGSDGMVMASVGAKAYKSTNGDAGTFTKISAPGGAKDGLLDETNVGRMLFAFAPSDPNFIYCLATGVTKNSQGVITGYPLNNIYQSKDKGQTWKVIGPGGATGFNPISSTGNFSATIAVDPFDPGFIIAGGRNLFHWSYKLGWERISVDEPTDLPNRGFYVHRDQHVVVFHPSERGTVFLGTSGGIAVTNNRGMTWRTLNRNYNVTQFISVTAAPTGEILGSTIGNGILYLDFQGSDPMYARWWGGNVFSSFLQFIDGGDVEISSLDPSFKFYTTYGGTLHRRMIIEGQVSYQQYYALSAGGPFTSPLAFHETYYDPLSWDTVLFIAERDYAAGEIIPAVSMIRKYPLNKVLEEPLATGDTIKVQDTYQAIIAIAKIGQGGVKMNRHPLNGQDQYTWQFYQPLDRQRLQVADLTVEVEFSSDAYYMFCGTYDNSDLHYKIYRVANLQNARDRKSTDSQTGFDPVTGKPVYVTVTQDIGQFNQIVTGIRVDPTSNDNVIVTLGNYGNTSNIYLCTNATTAPDSTMAFVSIQGNLPQAPVYDVLFNWRDHREVIVATEYGVYSTSNVFANPVVWASENRNGMEIVPVFELKQQRFENSAENGIENHGVVYAATFGRGIYKSESFATKGGSSSNRILAQTDLNISVTPNPVSDVAVIRFEMNQPGDVEFQIFDLQGKVVKTINQNNQSAGKNELLFDANEFNSGTYLIRMKANGQQTSSRFMIR